MSRQSPKFHPGLILTMIVSAMLIVSLIKNGLDLYQSRHRLDSVRQTTSKLETTKTVLEQDVAFQNHPSSLDQAIRNKLNVVLPGDIVITLPATHTANASQSQNMTRPSATAKSAPAHQWWQFINPEYP